MIVENKGNYTYKYDQGEVEEQVINALMKGDKTRSELVKITGIPRSSLYYYLERMEREGILERVPQFSGRSPRWCVNRKDCDHFDRDKNVEPGGATCKRCRDWIKIPGSPPLKESRGRPRILYHLLEVES